MSLNIPFLLMMTLALIVWGVMGARRIRWVRSQNGAIKSFATRADMKDAPVEVRQAADNFQNQFELPVLFYALCLYLAWGNEVGAEQIWLAYFFVAMRYLHSFIHCTYNRISHRFWVYVSGAAALWLMLLMTLWGLLFY